jgi:predicted DNA-binding transcriptional regulator AlpA
MPQKTGNALDLPMLAPVVDLAAAAQILGIGRSASYRLVREGQFPVPVLRVGRLIRVPTAPLIELLGMGKST